MTADSIGHGPTSINTAYKRSSHDIIPQFWRVLWGEKQCEGTTSESQLILFKQFRPILAAHNTHTETDKWIRNCTLLTSVYLCLYIYMTNGTLAKCVEIHSHYSWYAEALLTGPISEKSRYKVVPVPKSAPRHEGTRRGRGAARCIISLNTRRWVDSFMFRPL